MIHLFLIAVLALAGCASSGNASIKNKELLDQVHIGKSTKDDVRRLLGEPNSISRMASQVPNPSDPSQMLMLVEWWSYMHASSQTDAKSFIPFVGFLPAPSPLVQAINSGSYKGKSGVLNSQ
jgi:hypothetical protein